MKRGWVVYSIYGITVAVVLLIAYYGSCAVTAFSENIPIERNHHILIDPGHGGIDGGATSCSGIVESRYNLEIGLRLRDLMLFLGLDTHMTRESDISIYTKGETIAQKKASDLKERVRLANEKENTVLLSIHQNHFSDDRYHGAQVFYADTPGSEVLAKALQEAFCETVIPDSRRRWKKSSGIYLMEHIRCTGVLIECGFLSNQQEEVKLRDPQYQKELCTVIASSTSQFLSNT